MFVLWAFIVWIFTHRKRETLLSRLAEHWKVEQLLQNKQAAKARTKEWGDQKKEQDLSDYSNQIKFIEEFTLRSHLPPPWNNHLNQNIE